MLAIRTIIPITIKRINLNLIRKYDSYRNIKRIDMIESKEEEDDLITSPISVSLSSISSLSSGSDEKSEIDDQKIGRTIKINIVSDLHTEFGSFDIRELNPDADVVVLAGDIGVGMGAISLIKEIAKIKPVIMVLGNHELYHHGVSIYDSWLRIRINNFYFLHNSHIDLFKSKDSPGLRFIGSTLWSDLAKGTETEVASTVMNDYRLIPKWTPYSCMKHHNTAYLILTEELLKAREEDIPTVMITHHLPTYQAIHPRYKNFPNNGSFASNLDGMIYYYSPLAWIFGHTHTSIDFMMKETRMVCNPRGYKQRNSSSFENRYFDGKKIITITL